MSPTSKALTENLAQVRERIAQAASHAARRPQEITLVAISKTHAARKIQDLYEAGVRHFGENRVQEQESKRVQLAGLDATWHMVGHVQKNKAARAVQLFESVDSVDSIALAEKLNRAKEELLAEVAGKGIVEQPPRAASANPLRILIEVKLDPEPAKSGVDGDDLPRLATAIARLPHLDLQGLMGVPPYFDNPEEARPYFRRLRELRDALRTETGKESLPILSMGMSHDLEIAIEEGATEVRIGTALFGEREGA